MDKIGNFVLSAGAEKQKKEVDFLATVAHVYADGVSLLLDGETTATRKHYRVNASAEYTAGQRVKCRRISGTILVEYPVAAQGTGPVTELSSIAVTRSPTKTVYNDGEAFDPTGMIVVATYSDGTTAEIGGYTWEPQVLHIGDEAVTISYTELGVTKTASCQLYVDPGWEHNFADNTWADIVAAAKARTIPQTWVVGDHKDMTISGTTYQIDIIGFDHDDLADGSGKAAMTLMMHDCLTATKQMNKSASTTGGWKNAGVRTSAAPDVLAAMPAAVKTGIAEVSKEYTSSSASPTDIALATDKLFILSELEVFGTVGQGRPAEGAQYAYFAAGNPKVKKVGGAASAWWLRSIGSSSNFRNVNASGGAAGTSASSSLGVSFAFCF